MISRLSFLIVLALVFSTCQISSAEDVVVELPKGKIKGHTMTSISGNEYYGFHQIYYAAAPVGELRYKPPQEREAWTDTLDATENTVICFQPSMGSGPPSFLKDMADQMENSEDCLYVNVFTPLKPGSSDERLPVYVFVHGGGFKGGSGSDYMPTYFIDQGIVVVTVNYRLGALGFLSTEDDVIPGNLGLKDQRLAFEWVHDNIEYFNGNASQVTIGGQSAGSACVGLQVIGQWSSDKVLFHGAIQQSSSPIWNYYNDDARAHAFELGRLLDSSFNSNDSTELLKVLQAASADDILNAEVSGHYAPIIESSGDFSYPMLDSFMTGNIKQIPILIGFNSEEKINTQKDDTLLANYDADPSIMLNSNLLNIEDKRAVGELIRKVYTDTSFSEDFAAYVRYFTDDTFATTSIKEAELSSKYTNVYLYQFAYKGELGGNMDASFLEGCERVGHGEEMNYMWGGMGADRSSYSEADQLASERTVALWSNFIKTGNPTPPLEITIPEYVLGNLTWPTVDPNDTDNIPYLNLNETLEIKVNPRSFQKVKSVYDKYLQAPFVIYTNNDGNVMML